MLSQLSQKHQVISLLRNGSFCRSTVFQPQPVDARHTDTATVICLYLGTYDKLAISYSYDIHCVSKSSHLQTLLISQGSVATCLKWGGHCRISFVANFMRFPAVQKFWKSVKIWKSYRQLNGGNFFETQCICGNAFSPSYCLMKASLSRIKMAGNRWMASPQHKYASVNIGNMSFKPWNKIILKY